MAIKKDNKEQIAETKKEIITENINDKKAGYIASNLSQNEKILVAEKISGWCFKPLAYMMMFVDLLLFIPFIMVFFDNDITVGSSMPFIIFVILTLWYWFYYTKIEMAVSNKRVVLKTGIFIHNTEELRLEKVEAVNIKKSLFGLIFGYGDIIFSGTGGKTVKFSAIKNSQIVKNNIEEIFNEYSK